MAYGVGNKNMFTLKVNTKGCKNCSASIFHLLETFCELTTFQVDTESGTVSLPDVACVHRVEALLQTSGWRVDRKATEGSPNAIGIMEDGYFILPEDNDCVTKKKARLSDHQVNSLEWQSAKVYSCQDTESGIGLNGNNPTTSATRGALVPVLSPEAECSHTHWVPAWAALVHRGPGLQRFYATLNRTQPADKASTLHLKRIDSCRNVGSTLGTTGGAAFSPVFLGFSGPSFRFEDAAKLISIVTEKISAETGEVVAHLVAKRPKPCWSPLCAPITRRQQLLYSSDPTVHNQKPHRGANGEIIFGWPTTLRASPELDHVVHSDSQLSKKASGHGYFSPDEIEKHNLWLDQVVKMCGEAGPTISSCAGHFSEHPNAAIIVDPIKNYAVAMATTHAVGATSVNPTSILDHAVLLAVEETARQCMADDGKLYYLCTGLDAYVAWEPCIMCSMALVHNRIKRVFCANRLAFAGGFTNNSRIHTEKRLNHRFHVYAPADC